MYGNVVVAPISYFTCDEGYRYRYLPANVAMGSQAIVIATGDLYIEQHRNLDSVSLRR